MESTQKDGSIREKADLTIIEKEESKNEDNQDVLEESGDEDSSTEEQA